MKIIPVISEKTTKEAKLGRYTFKVDSGLNKHQIKSLINKNFNVHVISINTIQRRKQIKITLRRTKKTVKAYKKAVVMLKNKEKLDIFETKK